MVPVKVWSSAGGVFKPQSRESVFVFGYGYTAVELGKQLRTKGWKVSGTCRSLERKRMLEENYGLDTYVFGPGVPLSNGGSQALCQATHLLSCVPPDPETLMDTVLNVHMNDIKERCQLRWIGYVSSTGVYGNHQGQWIDESTHPEPADRKSAARFAAENSWLELQSSTTSVQIFRAGGIYGPGRSVLNALRDTRSPRASDARHSRRFTSRIHVSDLCEVLMASMESPKSGRIYNVVDDDPASRSEAAAFGMELLGMTKVGMTKELPAGATRANAAEKRVSNTRIKEELGVKLLYPSYRQGLAAVVRADALARHADT